MPLLSNFTTVGPDGVTPGLGTTEFWLAAATEAITLADVFGLHHFTAQQDAAIMAGIPMVYIVARSLVKAAASRSPIAKQGSTT